NEAGFLPHGVHKTVRCHVNGIDFTVDEVVDLHLDGANKTFKVGHIAQLHFLRHQVSADARQDACTLAAQGSRLNLDALLLEVFQTSQHQPHDVGVQAAAKTFVCADHDNTHR